MTCSYHAPNVPNWKTQGPHYTPAYGDACRKKGVTWHKTFSNAQELFVATGGDQRGGYKSIENIAVGYFLVIIAVKKRIKQSIA
jgi:hypothetical protein